MIDTRDLRIGNFLLFEDNSVIEVRGIHPSGKNIHDGKKWIEVFRLNPIPLKSEELLKFGFKHNSIIINNLDKTLNISAIVGKDFYMYLDDVFGSSYDLNCIQSIHQLQNLYFALTATELTIK